MTEEAIKEAEKELEVQGETVSEQNISLTEEEKTLRDFFLRNLLLLTIYCSVINITKKVHILNATYLI